MAKFLSTSGVSYHLELLINSSKEKLILISPYLRTNDRIRQMLEDKDRMKIPIRVVYREYDLKSSEKTWLKSMKNIQCSVCQNLHAKCYLNEREAIITSMNLFEFSQVNNNEMGIYVTRDEDASLYHDIHEGAMTLVRISVEGPETIVSKTPRETDEAGQSTDTVMGFCIRCGAHINLNPMYPYCRIHFRTWKKYENDQYEEKFCHICGQENPASKARPACWECFNKNRHLLKFPSVLASSSAS